jgi:hypothetical protein
MPADIASPKVNPHTKWRNSARSYPVMAIESTMRRPAFGSARERALLNLLSPDINSHPSHQPDSDGKEQ